MAPVPGISKVGASRYSFGTFLKILLTNTGSSELPLGYLRVKQTCLDRSVVALEFRNPTALAPAESTWLEQSVSTSHSFGRNPFFFEINSYVTRDDDVLPIDLVAYRGFFGWKLKAKPE